MPREFYLVSPNVLGDAAGFFFGHAGLANLVQNAGLAVVNVPQNYHHGRSGSGSGLGLGFGHNKKSPAVIGV